MAELAGHNGAATTGNPITTNSKALFAVPSKQSETHCNGNGCTTELHYYDSTDTQDNGALVGSGGETSSSSSSSESEGSDEESSEEEEEEVSDEVALKQAGVELDWDMLGTPAQSGGMAPTQLLSEFVSCCVRDEYRAALILCKKILEFEPDNITAKEFFPVLQERLKLDEELSTESSSDESGDETTSSDASHDGETVNTCNGTKSHAHCST